MELLALKAVAMLSVPSHTSYILYVQWREQILAHTCILRHAHCDAVLHSEFSVCHGKLGWRQSWLLSDVFAIYGSLFFRLVLFSLSQHCLLYRDISMILDINCYKYLLHTMHTTPPLFFFLWYSCSSIFGLAQKLNIFPWNNETYSGTEMKRKIRVSRGKREQRRAIYTKTLNV